MSRAFLVCLTLLTLAAAGSLRAQSTPAKSAEKSAPPPAAKSAPAKSESAAPTKSEPAKPAAPAASTESSSSPAGVQKMASDFSKQREARLDDRKVLLEKLRTAKTDEEKQRLLTELRQQQQQRLDEQREAARLAREQLRDSRK